MRFDSLDQNRRVAAELDAINDRHAKALAVSLAKAAEPLAKQMSAYLQAVGDLIRNGTDTVSSPSGDVVFPLPLDLISRVVRIRVEEEAATAAARPSRGGSAKA